MSSKSNKMKKVKLIGTASKAASAIEAVSANTKITTTSDTMVTPRVIWVNGPLARNSWMIAIADDGERAIRIEAIIMEIATFSKIPSPDNIEIELLTK